MKKVTFLAGLALLALAGTAAAVPITGSIAFGTADGASWAATTSDLSTPAPIWDADGIVFIDGTAGGTADDGRVTNGSGTYAGLNGTLVDFTDFVFDPLSAGTTLWSFSAAGTAYSFTMDSITSVFQMNGVNLLALEGTGVAKTDGFTDTLGVWSLTLNGFDPSSFSFSASAAAVPEPTPEPGIALLVGLGLVGFGATRKMRKSA